MWYACCNGTSTRVALISHLVGYHRISLLMNHRFRSQTSRNSSWLLSVRVNTIKSIRLNCWRRVELDELVFGRCFGERERITMNANDKICWKTSNDLLRLLNEFVFLLSMKSMARTEMRQMKILSAKLIDQPLDSKEFALGSMIGSDH